MEVLILAAGIGSRLTSDMQEPVPKALASVGSETILERQVRQLSGHSVTNYTVVIGGEGPGGGDDHISKFKNYVDNIVVNEKNRITEACYSMIIGLRSIPRDERVLVIDGDVVFGEGIISKIGDYNKGNIALVRTRETREGINKGANVDFLDNGNFIKKCSFEIKTKYVYSGAIHLSKSTVKYIRQKDLNKYKNYELYKIINNISQKGKLKGHVVRSTPSKVKVSRSTLDGYLGDGKTTIQKRKNRVVKRAHNMPKKMRDEISMIKRNRPRYPNHFPKILETSFYGKNPSYETHNYKVSGYEPLDKMIMGDIEINEIKEIVSRAIEFILCEFGSSGGVIPGLHQNSFLPKIETRNEKLGVEGETFKKIVESDSIVVNGEKLSGVPLVKKMLKRDSEFICHIEPKKMSEFHGDFKPDNILVSPNDWNFILIDPRGRSEIGTVLHDPLYDVAKFLTSVKGYYTALKNGHFEADISLSKRVNIDYEITENRDRYKDITKKVNSCAVEYTDSERRYNMRVNALTGLLLVANAPVHAGRNEKMAIVELARGLEIFATAANSISRRANASGEIINVNTFDDLELARKLCS